MKLFQFLKVWRPFVAMTLLGFVLTACVDNTDNPVDPGHETTTGDDASDIAKFIVTQTVVNNNGESTQKVALRYYEDMPHVAYISVSDFQNMLVPSKSIRVSKTAASQYQLVTSKGETAMVNTAEESMTFDDYLSFVSLSVNAEGVADNDDELFYVREKPMEYTPATASATFNMKKYGIDLRGDGQMVYVPLITLSDMYSNLEGKHVFFNGEKIILTDFEITPVDMDKAFFMKPYEATERPADLAAYSYGELCFAIDHFYGRPGRNAIDNIIEQQGLDQALSESHRKLLKSTNMNEYTFGLEYLAVRLADGSHTTISPMAICSVLGMTDVNILGQFMKKFITPFMASYPTEVEAVEANIRRNDGSEMVVKARQQLLNTDSYTKIGNTMYYIFDNFGPIESKAWTKYYKGTGPLPTYDPQFKGDICGIVEALDKAAADPEVKNFVLDLTCNNGGELSVLMTITALLAGKMAEGFCYQLSSARARLVNKGGENIDGGIEPHIALEVKQATGKDDDGDDVKYSDFSAFYAPSVGEQIVSWYAGR